MSGSKSARVSLLMPLGLARFRRLWASTLCSNTGTWSQYTAIYWSLSEQPNGLWLVTTVYCIEASCTLVSSIVAGTLADLGDRISLVRKSQQVMLASSIALCVVFLAGTPSLITTLILVAIFTSAAAVRNVSWQASLGDLVPARILPSAVTLHYLSFNLARATGPLIAGAIFAFSASPSVLAVAALLQASALAVCITSVKIASKGPPVRAILTSIASGFSASIRDRTQRIMLVRAGLFGVTASVIFPLLPFVIRTDLSGTALHYSLALFCFGLGSAGAAVLLPIIRPRMNDRDFLSLSGFALSGGVFGLAAASHMGAMALSLVLCGASWLAMTTIQGTSVQMTASPGSRGRFISAYSATTFGAFAVGGAVWSCIAGLIGVKGALLVAGALTAASALNRSWPHSTTTLALAGHPVEQATSRVASKSPQRNIRISGSAGAGRDAAAQPSADCPGHAQSVMTPPRTMICTNDDLKGELP